MPELPEVETVRRGLASRLVGHVITRVDQRCEALRIPLPARFAARVGGRRVAAVRRRGKYILVDLDGGDTMIVHLGMSGRMIVANGAPPPPQRHDHLVFHTDAGVHVTFNDTRRFGLVTLAKTDAVDRHPLLADLGIEPIDAGFTGAALAALFAGRRTPLKAALLDQRLIAGLGNIYACESLFRAKLSPRRKASTVTGRRAERLARAVREVVDEAIAAGGSSLRDYVQASGELGYFQHRFRVYDREGAPCPRCAGDARIRRLVQSGRSTFYCSRCQR